MSRNTELSAVTHLSDLGIVTQRNCASSILHFSLLVVYLESKILKDQIPKPASFIFPYECPGLC